MLPSSVPSFCFVVMLSDLELFDTSLFSGTIGSLTESTIIITCICLSPLSSSSSLSPMPLLKELLVLEEDDDEPYNRLRGWCVGRACNRRSCSSILSFFYRKSSAFTSISRNARLFSVRAASTYYRCSFHVDTLHHLGLLSMYIDVPCSSLSCWSTLRDIPYTNSSLLFTSSRCSSFSSIYKLTAFSSFSNSSNFCSVKLVDYNIVSFSS